MLLCGAQWSVHSLGLYGLRDHVWWSTVCPRNPSVHISLQGRAGKALIAFSSITRTLMVHVLGIGGFTIKGTGIMQGPSNPASIAYAMMHDGIGTVEGT